MHCYVFDNATDRSRVVELSELAEALEGRGYATWPGYPIAGFHVDLVIESDGRSLGIDLVGYPGEYAGTFELERYRLFNRAGLRILPLPYSAWRRDPQQELAAIDAELTTVEAGKPS